MQGRVGQSWRGELGDLRGLALEEVKGRGCSTNCQAGCQQHACDTLVTSHQGRGRKEGGRVGSLGQDPEAHRLALGARGLSRSLSVLPSPFPASLLCLTFLSCFWLRVHVPGILWVIMSLEVRSQGYNTMWSRSTASCSVPKADFDLGQMSWLRVREQKK